MKLKYTTVKPTKADWYWLKGTDGVRRMCQIYQVGEKLQLALYDRTHCNRYWLAELSNLEFAGPIPGPGVTPEFAEVSYLTANGLRQYFLIHQKTEISLTRDEVYVIDKLDPEPRPITFEEVIDHVNKEAAK